MLATDSVNITNTAILFTPVGFFIIGRIVSVLHANKCSVNKLHSNLFMVHCYVK